MPKTKAKTTSTMSDENVVVAQHQQQHQHIERLRDAVAVLAEQEAEARRQADDYARQQLSPVVVRSAQARAVELQQRLTDANTALFEAETAGQPADQRQPRAESAAAAAAPAEPEPEREPQAETAVQQTDPDLLRMADERAALVTQLDVVTRSMPGVAADLERRRADLPALTQLASDVDLLLAHHLPLPPEAAQRGIYNAQEAQRQLAQTQREVERGDHDLARLRAAARSLPDQIAAHDARAQRLRVLKKQDAARRDALTAERAHVLGHIHAAAAQFVLALGEAGRFNWRRHLLEMPRPLGERAGEYEPQPPRRVGMDVAQQPRPAPDALCAPILWPEVLPALSYLPQLPLLAELPDDFVADVASWGKNAEEAR